MNCHPKSVIRVLAWPLLLWSVPGFILLSPGGFGLTPCAAAEVDEAEGVEVLTRGPVHEAFAETVVFKPVQGILVPKAPPTVIEELPPDQRPDGDNVTWIPGYWAWEDEGSEYLWVSGIWRNLPPGRQWVPGYWQDADQEYQWVSGYWADAEAEEIEYLPEPPASVEAGPNIKRPSKNSIWISGSWRYNQNRYRWRPGYWDTAQTDWVWVPAHYIWSRRGYIFVDGYWDYSVARRGMIFAPVRFRGDYYSRPNYHYRPSTVISLATFTNHLFLRPRSRHYYFGDYYDPSYRRSGYYSSHSYYSGGHGYDPIYAHQRWIHRDDTRWERQREEDFQYFRDHREERPPHTFAALTQFIARQDSSSRIAPTFATPLTQFVTNKESTVKFRQVNEEERQTFAGRAREIREFGAQRKQLATKALEATEQPLPGTPEPGKVQPGKEPVVKQPIRERFRRSPIIAKATDAPAPADTPPARPEVSATEGKADPKIPDQPGGPPGRRGKEVPGAGDKPLTDPTDTPPSDQPGKKPKPEPGDTPPDEPDATPKDSPKDPRGNPKDPKRRGPKFEPGTTPTPLPKVEPKETPPMPEPKTGPTDVPQPKVEPKDPPKPEPKVEPKDSPRSAPKTKKDRPNRDPKVKPVAPPPPESDVEPIKEPKTSEVPRKVGPPAGVPRKVGPPTEDTELPRRVGPPTGVPRKVGPPTEVSPPEVPRKAGPPTDVPRKVGPPTEVPSREVPRKVGPPTEVPRKVGPPAEVPPKAPPAAEPTPAPKERPTPRKGPKDKDDPEEKKKS